MLTPELKIEAAELGAAWGKQEAELAADQGIAPAAWQNGRYCGWLPAESDEREEYDRIIDQAAKAAYEAARDGGAE
jgi:hypothetical protein